MDILIYIFYSYNTYTKLNFLCKVLDLYSQPPTKSPSQSPPQPGGKQTSSPPSQSKNGNEKTHTSPEPALPPPLNTRVPPPTDVPPFPYQTFTHAPPPLAAYAAPVSFAVPPINTPPPLAPPPGPPPHMTAPPPNVFPPYSHPPPFTPVVPPPTGPPPPFYSNGLPPPSQPPPHRPPFYPPP